MMSPIAYLRLGAFGALLGIIAWLAIQSYGLHIGPFGIEGDKRHISRLQTEVADMHKAGELATAQQIAANDAISARYSVLKDKADAEHRHALESALSAAATYALRHDARKLCAPGGSGSGSVSPPAEDHPAAPADGPGSLPDLVAVPRAEFDDFVSNTIRLDQIVNRYASGLIDEGLAIPEPEF